ncbi:MAG TPA: hypothetical protein VKX25_04000 [Bryobacteraceae bacterium]|nr:hypothetical protein [Bryobacteraceae bacterium]
MLAFEDENRTLGERQFAGEEQTYGTGTRNDDIVREWRVHVA